MAVLALDLGWTFGWCVWLRGDRYDSGVVKLASESPDDGVRLLAFRQWLAAKRTEIMAAGETLNDVAYERVDFLAKDNGLNAAHVWGAQWGNLASWCAHHRIDLQGLAVSTIKKHATGHGSASRALVLDRMRARFPNVVDPDQASAVAVMLTAQNKFPHQAEAA